MPRDCADRVEPGTAGVARHAWTAPAAGQVDVNLHGGTGGDWDLAVFHAGERRAAGASTGFGSQERVTTWVRRGERILVQGCRRQAAGSRSVPVSFDLFRRADLPPVSEERISLESVAISGPEDLGRLEALGLDVTHDVSSAAATVATYSDAERALLGASGFASETLVEDLAATDAANRKAEARGGPQLHRGAGLPSGRTGYREYADYTTEMKDLAEDRPAIVREVTIGNTFEGRPIEGLEIAGDVNATGDGRPVYLNIGAHHAREWPSAELPMEFAIDLVNGYGSSNRITNLLDEVRVIVIPVINVDGFLASRSYGYAQSDNTAGGGIPDAFFDRNAYKRKNCRPTGLGDNLLPCNARTNSGVDLNRNYGAYWGGSGSSGDTESSSYRGTAPFSEPESEAVHQFTAGLHPTVVITNHTFTDDGKWLRQPGFDDVVATTPDEAAMKDLGDAMAAATGWTSELGYTTLGDITGATEDWNYFAQGAYGYTPEARGVNFHAEYSNAVVEEYVGDAQHAGEGVREAFLVAGERAADASEHSIVTGDAPAAATLRLHKEFETPTCIGGPVNPCVSPALVVDDVLDTTLAVPASGEYTWHVNPSGRPFHASEKWTMSCKLPGEDPVTTHVSVLRGAVARVDWDSACGTDDEPPPPPKCGGEVVTLVGTPGDDRGKHKLLGTAGEDVILALGGKDVIRGGDEDDIICAGRGADKLRGENGFDDLYGENGADTLIGGADFDELRGGKGRDRCRNDGQDFLRGCARNG